MNLVNQIRLLGGKVNDQRMDEKIMINLPEKFESKLFVIEKYVILKNLLLLNLSVSYMLRSKEFQ